MNLMKLEEIPELNQGDVIEIDVDDPDCPYFLPIQATYLDVIDPKEFKDDSKVDQTWVPVLVYKPTEEYVKEHDRDMAGMLSLGFPLPVDSIRLDVIRSIRKTS